VPKERYCTVCGFESKPVKSQRWTWDWVQRDQAYIDNTDVDFGEGWFPGGGFRGRGPFLSNPLWDRWVELFVLLFTVGVVIVSVLTRHHGR
jgi:hypothetical protein